MPERPPTIRTLARTLGLSRTTVSDALNGRGRVDPRTADRVRAMAASLGYQVNPLRGAVMSALRRARSDSFHGAIAAVDVHEPGRMPHGPFHREIIGGLSARAVELGFAVEEFEVGPRTIPVHRLDRVLLNRSIRGVVVLPSFYPPDLSGLSWNHFSGVYTDYLIEKPVLNSVCADHYHLMMEALTVLHARGYRRPGYLVARGRDDRIEHRQTAAFCAFQSSVPGVERVPVLITPGEPRFEEEFRSWFERHDPDVVLSHSADVLDWMEACGARVPDTHGFVLLNVVDSRRPCASMDLQGRVIGVRAAEILIGEILRNERGSPEWPARTAIQSRWVDGPTVRPA